MKKKANRVAESDNWNDLGGNQQFPNYFGNDENQQEQQKE